MQQRRPRSSDDSLDGLLREAELAILGERIPLAPRARRRRRAAGGEAETPAVEAAWAFNHPGKVNGFNQEKPAEGNEIIFWNYLVGNAEPRPAHLQVLRQVIPRWRRLLQERPDLRVRIVGSASTSGRAERNLDVAQRRAAVLQRLLKAGGIPGDRVEVAGEGTSRPLSDEVTAEDMARDRRAEVFLFVPTRQVASHSVPIQHAAAGINHVLFNMGSLSLLGTTRANLEIAERIFGIAANLLVTLSGPPGSQIGFLQFLRQDVRLATYRPAAGSRTLQLDFSRCFGSALPCRDIEEATNIFSLVGLSFSSGPTAVPVQINFRDSPGTAFPLFLTDPTLGPVSLAQSTWAMEFVLVLATRFRDELLPIHHLIWKLESQRDWTGLVRRVAADPTLPQRLRTDPTLLSNVPTGVPMTALVSTGPGLPPGLDVAAAMSGRTCRLLARSTEDAGEERVCRPKRLLR